MEDRVILSLDLSTTCTGWSVLCIKSKKLITYGKLVPKVKDMSKMTYPRKQLEKMKNLSGQILNLIKSYTPEMIIIEEITSSKQRLGQKTLDGFHYIMIYYCQKYLDIFFFYDVTGLNGWRTHLNIKLSEADKVNNKESKKLNKTLDKKQKLPIIGPKHLACRFVNEKFGMDFDPNKDNDIADSICMGYSYLTFIFTKQ